MKVDHLAPKQSPRAWLLYQENPDDDKRPKIKWIMKSSEGRVDISNLTKKEVEAVEAFINGTSYIRCVNGRLNAYSVSDPLPDAETDPLIGPHWASNGEVKHFGGLDQETGWHSPGIVITALGAGIIGDHAEERRRVNQKRVKECGFTCLRSPRGHDGMYWEQWVLHYLSAAKGPLGEFVKEYRQLEWKALANSACEFLARDMGIQFGSMDVTIQRWALCNPE